MDKVILLPDSFKGTMSSVDICGIMSAQILKYYPNCEVVSIPVADGGEGSVDCFLRALGGKKTELQVSGPLFEDMTCFYGLLGDGTTAIIEMSACAGLPLIEHRKDPLGATTYGVGQLIVDAAKRGAKKIIVGLGGSATNDGGCGAAAAAGVRFLDAKGKAFTPTGGTLHKIENIDDSRKCPLLKEVEICAMCDIDNPMFGPTGAATVFGPQKGATPEMVRVIDRGLTHLSSVIHSDLGIGVGEVPGAGAAGAMGAGMLAFFGAKLQMGIETVLDAVGFDEIAADADMVLTGEGKIDSQSLRGKVVCGVAHRAKRHNVPVIAVVGDIGDNTEPLFHEGLTAVFSTNRVAVDFELARSRARKDMKDTIDNLMRFCKRMGL